MVRALLLLIALLPASLLAAEPLDYNATYVLADEQDAAQRRLDGIEAVVQHVPGFVQGLVRRKLTDGVPLVRRFAFTSDGQSVSVQTDDEAPAISVLGGPQVRVERRSGQVIRMKRWMQDGVLTSQGDTSNGTSYFRFRLSPDGQRMTLHVTTTSSALPVDVTYEIPYRREG